MIRLGEIPVQWRTTLGVLAVALMGLLLVYWHTAFSIVNIWWRSGTFAHGFLILPISGWLSGKSAMRLRNSHPGRRLGYY